MKKAIRYLHRTAGVAAFLMILTFFTSTLVVELWGDQAGILAVKNAIAMGVWVLVPLMIAAGGTGFKMVPNARKGPLGNKKKRMHFIALNGLLVLLPSALYLDYQAGAGRFETQFYLIQGTELIAGLINLTLMGLNIRDGIRLTRAHNASSNLQAG
ncbi:hypothetical protein VV869_06160 [Photobacterium sp. MCCC 1A19761]|uniref:hypothetical protein n=1 Tax=Photobacterium sp. MCCC 1A19761 TaxID=3115000 RepID=UPI00307E23C4